MSSIKTLGDYLSLITYGFTNPMSDAPIGPWKITAKDIINGRINYSTARRTTQVEYDELLTAKSKPQVNDILLTKDGTLGRVAIVDRNDICINQSVALLRPKDSIHPQYLYYLLMSPTYQRKMIAEALGTTIKHIYISKVGKMDVSIPEIEKQNTVVKILQPLDKKADINNRDILSLTQLIQTLYQSWFSNFNYPGATGEMRQSENLQTSVPKEWKEMKFGKFLTPCSERIGDVDVPIYSTTNNGIALRDEKFIKNLSKSKSNNKKIVKDDLIFGLSREILNFGVVTAEVGSVSPVYQIFKIDQTIFLPFMLELEIRLNMPQYMDILQLGAREGQGINRDYLLGKYILVPDMRIQERFAEIYVAIQKRIEKLKEENTVLAEIRDTLLPKLISGELPVRVGED